MREDERKENNRQKGSLYEERTASFFVENGFEILEKNYRRKTGEIDLVVRDPDGTIAFVEVKYRKAQKQGFPEEAVTKSKQMRIRRTAEWYLCEKRLPSEAKYRFDVVSILDGDLTYIRNAFGGF